MPRSCSVPGCKAPAGITLTAKPSGWIKNEVLDFGFCRKHGPIFADLGYRPQHEAYQESLGVEVFDS